MQMIQSRNQAIHSFDQEVMEQIASAITGTCAKEFSKLQVRLGELEAEEIGRSSGREFVEALELQRLNEANPFMQAVGTLDGPAGLSRRKGFHL